jgi:hypothetical protein
MTNDELYAIVPIGKENAKPLSYFTDHIPVTGREIRRMFERLTENEKPVCNLRFGYYRPATYEELEEYRLFINSYRCKLLKKEYRIKKALRHFGLVPMSDKPNTPEPHQNAR